MSNNSYCGFVGCIATLFASTHAPDECSVPVIGVMEAVPWYTVVQPRRPQYTSFFWIFAISPVKCCNCDSTADHNTAPKTIPVSSESFKM